MEADLARVTLDAERALAAASKAIDKATKSAMTKAGNTARKELLDRATEGPGSDRVYSGLGPRSKLQVRLKHVPGGVLVIPKGHWAIAERGRQAKGTDPGTAKTQGKQSWTRGRLAAFQRIERDVPEEIADEVGKGFRRG